MVRQLEQSVISMFAAVGFVVSILGGLLFATGHIKVLEFAGKIAILIN